MTQTPASGPFGPLTIPARSSASMAIESELRCAAVPTIESAIAMRTPSARDVCITPPARVTEMRNGSISSTRVPSGSYRLSCHLPLTPTFGGVNAARAGSGVRRADSSQAVWMSGTSSATWCSDTALTTIRLRRDQHVFEVFGAVGHTHVHPLRDPFRTAAAPDFRESQHVLVERVGSLFVSNRQAGVEDAFGKRAAEVADPAGSRRPLPSARTRWRDRPGRRRESRCLHNDLAAAEPGVRARRDSGHKPSRPASRTRDGTGARRRQPASPGSIVMRCDPTRNTTGCERGFPSLRPSVSP